MPKPSLGSFILNVFHVDMNLVMYHPNPKNAVAKKRI